MARKITFTEEERTAVAWAAARLGPPEMIKALRKLLRKINAAVERDAGKQFDALDAPDAPHPWAFLKLAKGHLGDRLAVPDKPTPTYLAILGRQLKAARLSDEAAHELCAHVATWVTRPISPGTLVVKSEEWLARARAERKLKEDADASKAASAWRRDEDE